MFIKICALVSICLSIKDVYSANILGVFIVPSISHQSVFQTIWKELSLRGHQVTVLTPNPLRDRKLTNLTEIDLSFTYKIIQEHNMQSSLNKDLPTTTVVRSVIDMTSKFVEAELAHPEVQALIRDKSKKFDVLLVEYLHPTMYALSARFECPMIGVASAGTFLSGHDAVGNPSHPIMNLDFFLPFTDDLCFFDRLYSLYYWIWFRYFHHYELLPEQDKVARKYISKDIPYLGDIEKNVSMVFLNSNPIIHPIRANVPALIELGNMHIIKKKPLPVDLQKELDEATQGVVYFSLGSNVRISSLSVELLTEIKAAISEIPFKVLLKWEEEEMVGKPNNVVARKWFPQQDVLGHPNIKAFVTQGGLQSMEEAIFNGVPLVGIPFFADQPLNVKKMVKLGIAKEVDPQHLTKQQLKAAIIEVAGSLKYRNRIEEIRGLTSDMPMTGLEKAVWWTEYVIRHKGASHLRSPALDIPWHQYFLLDVLMFLFGILLILIFVLYKIISLGVKVLKTICRKNKQKIA